MAEGGGLLNRYTVKSRIVGSNPILSAITLFSAVRIRSRSTRKPSQNRHFLINTDRDRLVVFAPVRRYY